VEAAPLEAPATAPTRAISPQLYNLPDLIGDFFAHGSSVVPNNVSLQFKSAAPINAFDGGVRPLAFNGIQYVGPRGFVFNATGSGITGVQPATILGTIPSNQITLMGPGQTTVGLRENQLFTQAVQSLFPGATFVSGSGLYTFTNPPGTPVPPIRPPGPFDFFQNVFVYSAVITNHQTIDVLVSNPAGGGLVGRNRYFENGSAIPRDRVYFYYSGVSDFSAPGRPLNINRYTLGGEMTFLSGRSSIEARLPMAGTLNSDQSLFGGPSSGNYELGNLGVLAKYAVVAMPRFVLTTGFGVSLPTADDSRVRGADGRTILEVENQTALLQPIVGFAWVPTEELFFQGGMQLDIDPSGNSVYSQLGTTGNLQKAGVLTDQTYGYLHGGIGYTVYRASPTAYLSAVSVLGELHYSQAMGRRDFVQTGLYRVGDINSQLNALNATLGVNCVLSNRASVSAGLVMPCGGTKMYDWAAQAQLNWRFGGAVRRGPG
jgi:hypothetical protein